MPPKTLTLLVNNRVLLSSNPIVKASLSHDGDCLGQLAASGVLSLFYWSKVSNEKIFSLVNVLSFSWLCTNSSSQLLAAILVDRIQFLLVNTSQKLDAKAPTSCEVVTSDQSSTLSVSLPSGYCTKKKYIKNISDLFCYYQVL